MWGTGRQAARGTPERAPSLDGVESRLLLILSVHAKGKRSGGSRNESLPLLPEEGKENAGEYADLTNPKNEHPLNKVGPQVVHFCSQLTYLPSHFRS